LIRGLLRFLVLFRAAPVIGMARHPAS